MLILCLFQPCVYTYSFLTGNSLRALVKYLDNIPENVIPSLNIPTGVPLVYELDADLRPIKHPDAIAPLSVSTWFVDVPLFY